MLLNLKRKARQEDLQKWMILSWSIFQGKNENIKKECNYSANKVAEMKKLKQVQSVLASSKAELRRKYNVRELGIFGSYARGQQKKTSDVDILVKFSPNATLFDFVGLGDYLEEKLKIKVDVVSERGIRPELKSDIIKDVIMV